jgi:hypothetical protein
MTRLQDEFRRLYLPSPAPDLAGADALVGPDGRVRALVVELVDPADWDALAPLWRGVQTELDLPAPAIAVSGSAGMQLWFSLADAVEVAPAQAFLQALRRRFLAALPERRLRLWPRTVGGLDPTGPADPTAIEHTARPPELQAATGNWSAFVAPDLAPLFSDTPWLDVPPGDDGQANLLAALVSIRAVQWQAALAALQPTPDTAAAPSAVRSAEPAPSGSPSSPALAPAPAGPTQAFDDPCAFLRAVMNDPTLPLASRIDAAKALLSAPSAALPAP